MQGEGEYGISDFIESLSPITLAYQSPRDEDHMWTFWSKEDVDSCKLFGSPFSLFHPANERDMLHGKRRCATPYQQWEIKEYLKSALLGITDPKYPSSANFLLQFWVPTTNTIGGRRVLKTSNQPFGLYKIERGLCEYRKHCMSYDDEFGVIELVFRNQEMKFTPNVGNYSTKDYPQLEFAVKCGVCRSLVLPVFEPSCWECVGVLEVVDFCGFQLFPFHLHTIATDILKRSHLNAPLPFDLQIQQCQQGTEDKVLQEMNKALEVVCTTHQLPFAQIWIPFRSGLATDNVDSPENSFYMSRLSKIFQVNDVQVYSDLLGFEYDCRHNLLRKGEGVVGKALLYRKPCFCRDVSELPIADYSFSHSAREYGLTGCFAIFLHTTLTKNHDSVLEFFLPPWNTAFGDPRTFLGSILGTMKKHLQGFEIGLAEESYVEVLNISIYDEPVSFRIFQTFRIQPMSESSLDNERREEEVQNNVTGEAVVVDDDDGWNVFGAEHNDVALACLDKRVDMLKERRKNEVVEELFVEVAKTDSNAEMTTILIPPMTETLQNETEVVQLSDDESAMEVGRKTEVNVVTSVERISSRGETSEEREYRTTHISLSREDLVKHFGKKLDDAARSLWVSRSTMKRACRVHGIKKWPSPKRKNVKPSPSNLNHVNAFVQGGNERVPKFSNSEPSCFNPPPMHDTIVVPQSIPNFTAKQDEGNVTVKATYGVEMIRFRLSFSSKRPDLMDKVTRRLPLKHGTFNIKYEDDDGDWVLISCDEDLEECISISKGKSKIKMSVQSITDQAP